MEISAHLKLDWKTASAIESYARHKGLSEDKAIIKLLCNALTKEGYFDEESVNVMEGVYRTLKQMEGEKWKKHQ